MREEGPGDRVNECTSFSGVCSMWVMGVRTREVWGEGGLLPTRGGRYEESEGSKARGATA
jgi:hypothetical protein